MAQNDEEAEIIEMAFKLEGSRAMSASTPAAW
jgi:hypothetical protein